MNVKRTLLSLLLTLLLSLSVTAAALPASALSPGGAAASVSLTKTTVATPQLKAATANSNGITVTWNKSAGAAKYRVFRKSGNSGWTAIGTVTGTSYTDKNVKAGTTYTYTVRCVSSNGKSYTSSYNSKGVSAKAKGSSQLGTPKLKAATYKNGSVTVTWNKVSGAAKYRVFRKTGSSGWKSIATVSGTSYTDKSVKAGTTYTYTVRCVSSNGKSYTSSYDSKGVSVKTTGSQKLNTPALKTAVVNNNNVTVTWGKVSGAAKYRVFRKTGNGSWTSIATVSGTSYSDKSIKVGTTYKYTVRCVSSDGKSYTSSYSSSGITAAVLKAPNAPSLFADNSGIKITWSKVSGAAKYRVFRKTNGGSWQGIATVNGTSYTDTTGKAGNTYTYTIRCYNSANSFASGYNTTGKSIKLAATPTLVSAVQKDDNVVFTWKAATGAVKYRVFRKTTGGWEKIADTTSTSYTDQNVKTGTTYTYTVRCVDSNGYVYTSGHNSTGVKVQIKAVSTSHTHSWIETTSIAPTCTSKGRITYTCSCGATKTETTPVDSNAHVSVSIKTTPATCTTDGKMVDTCTACGKIVSQITIPATGHEWNSGTVTKAPTCTEQGVKTYTCQTCDVTKTEAIAVTSHNWDAGTVTKAPTCTEQGVKTCTCQTCGTTKTETIAATGHTEVPEHKDATTTSTGYDRVVCSVCGKTISETVIPVIVDKSSLQSVYNEASELLNNATLELYRTTQSWSTMRTAANNAQSLLNSNTATQNQVDSATSALRSAIDGLESYTYSDGTLTYYEAQSKQILAQINEYRVENGLKALTWSDNYARVCLAQAGYNAIAYSLDYDARISNSWDPAHHSGALIACAYPDMSVTSYQATANDVLSLFQRSPTHNANLLSNLSLYNYAGVAFCSYTINGRNIFVCTVYYGMKDVPFAASELGTYLTDYSLFNNKPLSYYGCSYEELYYMVG